MTEDRWLVQFSSRVGPGGRGGAAGRRGRREGRYRLSAPCLAGRCGKWVTATTLLQARPFLSAPEPRQDLPLQLRLMRVRERRVLGVRCRPCVCAPMLGGEGCEGKCDGGLVGANNRQCVATLTVLLRRLSVLVQPWRVTVDPLASRMTKFSLFRLLSELGAGFLTRPRLLWYLLIL